MREVDHVFDTIITSFYKNKILSMIPDLVFTLESTRYSKATIISQKLLESKHKTNLRKGLDSLRRNVSRFYILQDKFIEENKSKDLATSLLFNIFLRKENKDTSNYFQKLKYHNWF